MVDKTKNTTTKKPVTKKATTKKTPVKRATKTVAETVAVNEPIVTQSNMSQDLKDAVLIVSLLANLFVFALWMVLLLTNQYDMALTDLFLNR